MVMGNPNWVHGLDLAVAVQFLAETMTQLHPGPYSPHLNNSFGPLVCKHKVCNMYCKLNDFCS